MLTLLSCLPCSVSWTVSCSVSATHRTCETTACTTHTAETLTTTAAPTQPWWKVSRTTPSAWNKPELPPPRCFYSTAFNLHQSLKDMEDGGDTFIFCLCGGNYWMLFDHTCPSKQNLPHWCRPCGHRPAAKLSVRLSLKLRSRDTPPDSLDTSTFSWLDVVPSPTCPRAQYLWWRWAKSMTSCTCASQSTGRPGVPAFSPGRSAQWGQQGHCQAERHRGRLWSPTVSNAP